MESSDQPLRPKPKYPPDSVEIPDDCAKIRKTLKELRDKRIQTDYPIELNRINSDIDRLTQDLADCENMARQLDAPSGHLDGALGDWSGSKESPPYNIHEPNPDTFIEREELKKLEKLLTPDQEGKWTNLICIHGSVGVGKSTLAFFFAEKHWKDRFPDGALSQDVGSKTVEDVARQFLRDSKIKLRRDDDPVFRFTDLFQQRRMLFIFDNADNDEIQELFPRGQKCAAVVTTRDKLFCPRIRNRIHLQPLSLKDGINLLTKEMGEMGKQRVQVEPDTARKIVELVGNLPLALSIAGSFLGTDESFSLSGYANRLEKAKLDLLIQEGTPERNVRACFQLSMTRLSQEVRDLFACLSVCAVDGFTAGAALAAAGYETTSTLERLNLTKLCRYSLLDNDKKSRKKREITPRYILQTLLREFARELAQERCLLKLAEDRHQEFIDKIREIKALEMLAEDSLDNIIDIDILDDILYAADWLKQKKIPEYSFGFKFCESFFNYHSAYNTYAVRLMSTFRELAESLKDWEYDIRCRVQQAKYMERNKSVDRQQIFKLLKPIEILLKRFESDEKPLVEGRYRNTYADVLEADGKYKDAIKQLRRAITIYQQESFLEGLAKAHTTLGNILRKKGDHHDPVNAVKEHREAVRLEKQRLSEGNKNTGFGLPTALTELGIALGELGEEHWQEAVNVLEESNNLKRALGNKMEKSLSMGLNSLGDIFYKLRQYDKAIAVFEESVNIKQKPNIKDIDGIRIVSDRWFRLLQEIHQQGNSQEAILYCDQAIQAFPANHQAKFLKFRSQLKN